MLLRWGQGGGLNALLGSAAFASDFGGGSVVLLRGAGSATFTRATVATLPWDFEGKPQNVLSGEVRFPGMRRVRNYCRSSTEDATSALWVTGTSASVGNGATPGVVTIALPAVGDLAYFRNNTDNVVGNTIVISCDVRCPSGSSTIRVLDPFAAQFNDAAVVIDAAWKRVSYKFTALNAAQGMAFRRNDAGQASAIEVRRPMIEDVTGQSNQNPSEYVSVGAAKFNELTDTENIHGGAWGNINTPDAVAAATPGFSVLTDNNAAAQEGRTQSTPLHAAQSDTWLGYVDILKDADQTRFPIVHLVSVNGGGSRYRIMVNTATGAIVNYAVAATSFGCVDMGASWRVYVSGPSNADTQVKLELYPAGGTVMGTENVAAVGSTTFGKAGLVRGTSILPTYFPVGNVYPFHGACADGVKYFATTNGNSVSDNVVTEATGEYIPKSGLGFARLPGAAVSYFSTPNSAANRDFTDLRIEALVRADDYTAPGAQSICAKYATAANSTFLFQFTAAGLPYLLIKDTTGNASAHAATASITTVTSDGQQVYVAVQTFISLGIIRFYWSRDGVTWIQLGTDVATAKINIDNTTQTLSVGAWGGGSDLFTGTISWVKVYKNDTLVHHFNPTAWTSGATFTGGAGETWTLNGGAAIRKWPRGYLPEEATTNLVLQSENFGTTWTAAGSPTRSAAAARCGSVVLDLIGDDSAAALEGYAQTVTFTGNAVKAVSLFVKQDTSTSSLVILNDATATADRLVAIITWSGGLPVLTMTVGTHLGTDTLADGVFRIRFATTSVTAANTNNLGIYPATTAAAAVANTGTLYVGGVQAENKTFCTSYVPTTTATVTRNFDNLTYPSAGNVSDTSGTLYFEGVVGGYTGAAAFQSGLFVCDGTANERLDLGCPGSVAAQGRLTVVDGGVTQADINYAAVAPVIGQTIRSAGRYALNDFAVASSGVMGSVDTAGTLPAVTQIWVGTRTGDQRNSVIQDVRIWTRALSDAELQVLTT